MVQERLLAMIKLRRLSWLGLVCAVLASAGLLALLEWHRREDVARAGELKLDGSGIPRTANELRQKYSDPLEFARLCAEVQKHYDALVSRSLRLQHLRKSRLTEFDRRQQPVSIVETLERIHFEGRKECLTILESRQVLGAPSASPQGGPQGGLNIKAPFSSEVQQGFYRYQLQGVEEIAGRLVLRVRFDPVEPLEGSFKGSVWIDPATSEPIRMHGSAVKPRMPLDRLEMLIDYGPAENGYKQMRRATVDVVGGFAFIFKHYRIEAELSDYQPRKP
jgi:hypothetical protein